MKKTFLILFTIFGASTASAETGPETITCSIDYGFDSLGNYSNRTSFHDAGEFSVQDCIFQAFRTQYESKQLTVKFIYTDYTKTTLLSDGSVDVSKGSEGWSLSATITEYNERPSQLQYKEFTNP